MFAAQSPGTPAPTVVAAEVTLRGVPIYDEFVARTDAMHTVELRARVEGFLDQVLFQEGAAVTQAELDLSYTTIQAPMDGLIGFLAVSRGNVVGPNQNPVLATMSTIDPIEVSFGISEMPYLHFVRRTGAVTRDKLPEVTFELTLADGSIHSHQGQAVAIERALDP